MLCIAHRLHPPVDTRHTCCAVVPRGVLLPRRLVEQLAEQPAEHAAALVLLLLLQRCCRRLGRVGHLLQRRQLLRAGKGEEPHREVMRRCAKSAVLASQFGCMLAAINADLPGSMAAATLQCLKACMPHKRRTSGGMTCSCPSTRPMRWEATTTGRPSTSASRRGQAAALWKPPRRAAWEGRRVGPRRPAPARAPHLAT